MGEQTTLTLGQLIWHLTATSPDLLAEVSGSSEQALDPEAFKCYHDVLLSDYRIEGDEVVDCINQYEEADLSHGKITDDATFGQALEVINGHLAA